MVYLLTFSNALYDMLRFNLGTFMKSKFGIRKSVVESVTVEQIGLKVKWQGIEPRIREGQRDMKED